MLAPSQTAVLTTVIVPTLNEVDNIDVLLAAIFAQARPNLAFEVLVADGGSTDGTIERVREWEKAAQVRLVSGGGGRGLAGDVLNAARVARTDIVVVMDADLSHPPERLGALVEPVLDGTCDMAVGSRYVRGGATPDWPLQRLLLSRLGGLLAWPLTELKDPMSGFFAVRRERLLAVDPEAAGFKIGLEVIAHGGGALKVREVPIVFPDRIHGESKIGKTQMVAYLLRLLVLAGGAVSAGGAARFALVGLIGMAVDLLVFELLFALHAGLMTAQVGSFGVATVSNYVLNARWAFADSSKPANAQGSGHYRRFFTVCLLALAIRGGVLAGGTTLFHLPPQIAILFAIGAAAIVSYLGSAFFVFPSVNPRVPHDIRWRVAAIGVVSYVVLLRLLFIGLANLLPEEAYYWNYAQHLDIGYLDHPPMVAWLIHVGTALFGNTEFGVRIGAWLCWFATAFFSFRLTHRMFGKSAAFVSLLLVAVLPFYFATGLIMTPDAPLTACWAGALFFLERALVGGRRSAWWGAGICIGLGMLSKYTIALLGPATLILMLADVRAREWLKRPQPYLAALLALAIFSPVIIWNLEHDLASFAFQSTRRIDAAARFSLPALILCAAGLLTPPGLIAAMAALWDRRRRPGARQPDPSARRLSRFILVFTLTPLAVFVVFSLTHTIKLNWTGPLWLATVPAMAAAILAAAERSSRLQLRLRPAWVPTVAVTLVLYGLGLNYLVLGLPGVGYVASLPAVPVAWREFGRAAETLERQVENATGEEPLMVGMDTYNIASQLAFYSNNEDGEGVDNSVGRGILGLPSLMYGYWHRAEPLRGRPAVLFSFKRRQIDDEALAGQFGRLGETVEQPILKDGKPAGRFFYRIGYDYRGPAGASTGAAGAPATIVGSADAPATLVGSLP